MTDEQFEIHVQYLATILTALSNLNIYHRSIPDSVYQNLVDTIQTTNQNYYDYARFQKLKKGKK